MALPALQQNPGSLGFSSDPTQREVLAATRRAHTPKRRPEDARRPAGARRQSLRRVKDSKEQLRANRSRGVSNATVESSTTSTTAGRSFTVANINNGIIYLRYVLTPRVFAVGEAGEEEQQRLSGREPLGKSRRRRWKERPSGLSR